MGTGCDDPAACQRQHGKGSIRPVMAWRRRGHAQAAVEAALVLPLILLLVVGVFAVGTVGRTDAGLLAVTEEAARAAATSANASDAAAHGIARGQQVADGYRLVGSSISVDARDFHAGGHVRVGATVT